MHVYFYSNGITFIGENEHRIIYQWEYDQAKAWGWQGTYDPKYINRLPNHHYFNYGFKVIKNLP